MATTLADLEAAAQERADMAGSAAEFTTFWGEWANDGIRELHRAICNYFKSTYFRTTPFALSGSTYQYTLPATIKRVKGVDLNPGTPRRQTVRPLDFASRNEYRGVGFIVPANICIDRRYTVLGTSPGILQLEPQENAAGNYALYWVPKPTLLTAPTDAIDPELEEYKDYVECYMAKFAAIKAKDFEIAESMVDAMNVIRADMAESVETDEGGASTIIDVDEFGIGGFGTGGILR